VDGRIQFVLRIITEQESALCVDTREISSLLMISEAHLLRLFRREVGTAFWRYRCELRMARATELLLGSGLSIKEVAFASGYGDVSNFYRDFKRTRGLGPKQWKIRELTAHPTNGNVADG
jgi:AraC-like DNA-binding protein